MNTQPYLAHHGVKGMKWGVRRYQNKDGSLTAAGKKRAAKEEYSATKKRLKSDYKSDLSSAKSRLRKSNSERDAAYAKNKSDHEARQKKIDDKYRPQLDALDKKIKTEKSFRDSFDSSKPIQGLIRSYSDMTYNDLVTKRNGLQTKYSKATNANNIVKKNADLKVSDLYRESSKEAQSRYADDRKKAVENYEQGLKKAKADYKSKKRSR